MMPRQHLSYDIPIVASEENLTLVTIESQVQAEYVVSKLTLLVHALQQRLLTFVNRAWC